MNKFFFVAFFVLTSAYSQYIRVTVHDQYGNILGYYNVQSDYLNDYNYDYSYGNDSREIAREVGNEIRMAVNDLIEYIEERESRAAAAKARELFNRRAAKYGLSSNEVFGMGESGINPAMEAAVGVMEAAERRKARERAEREYQAKRDAEIKRAVKSDVMNAYDYAKNIRLEYKKELGIKKGSGYFKLPTMLFKSQGKGKYVRQEGNVQMIYQFYWPGERNKDYASRYKGYETD